MLRSTLFLFLLLAIPAHANLGETIAQCVTRYGKPVSFTEASAKTPFGTLTFVAAGYGLIVFVLGDKEVGAQVSKADKSAFTADEMKNIMAADSAGSQWTPTASDDPTCLQWSRADNATVLYDKEKHMLIFTSPEMAQALHSAAATPTPAK